MYEESGCFDANTMMAQITGPAEDCFPQMVSESDPTLQAVMTATATQIHNTFAENVENLQYPYSCGEEAAFATCNLANRVAMEIIAHPQQNHYNHSNNLNTQFGEEVSNGNHGTSHDLSLLHHYTPTPDLLNLLHLPISPASPFGNSSVPFENSTHNNTKSNLGHATWLGAESTNVSSVSYDPFLHLNLQAPPQHGYTMPASRNDIEDGDERDFGNGVVEFTEDVSCIGKKRGGKRTKQFTSTTERQRRVDLSSKFDALKELIPNPSKSDRASVVGDAIDYIRELLRTVNELKLLAEKKKHEKQRMIKRHKVETEGDLKLDAIGNPEDNSYNESLRTSWIQRKSKDTEVDVRLVDNEVTIKLVQRRKANCLVHASHVLDELKLDLQHVAGGHIGDFSSFLFNSKICEGSSVYASAIANKLIEVMDTSLAAT